MSKLVCDSNGNNPGIEEGPLPRNSLGVQQSHREGVEQGPLDDSTHDLESPTESLNISSNPLTSDNPERRSENGDTSALNVSSDFLPTESPERKRISVVNGDVPESLQLMMLEIGGLEDSDASTPTQVDEFRTAIANRDNLIKRLSTNLQHLLKERTEDSQITSTLEDEMCSLRSQVRIAAEKAAKNKSYRTRYLSIESQKDELSTQLNIASAQLKIKTDTLLHLESEFETRESELETLKSESSLVILDLQSRVNEREVETGNLQGRIQLAEEESKRNALAFKEELKNQEEKHRKELLDLEERFQKELETMEDRYEEEQVVELNLLDAELLSVREERNDLRDRLQLLEKPGEETATETKSLEENQRKLLDEAEQERAVLVDKLSQLEKLYSEETSFRMSLEQNLNDVNSLLDDTQYNYIPQRIRESISRSLRSSENFSQKRESLVQTKDTVDNSFLPINITQLESDEEISHQSTDTETTPVHRPANNHVDETEKIASIKAEHEKEMSELRKYFENYCLRTEKRYRSEIEEHLSHQRHQPSRQGNIPLSLEISQGQLEFSELESMSPRSLDSSNLNSLGYQGQLSGQESDGQTSFHSRQNSDHLQSQVNNDLQSQVNTDLKPHLIRENSPSQLISDNLQPEIKKASKCGQLTADQVIRCCEEVAERDEEIIRLKSEILGLKSDLLESREFRSVSQRSRSENIARTTHEEEEEYCSRCRELSNTLANIQNLHIKEIERLKFDHEEEMTRAVEKTKCDIENDNIIKLEAVSKQLESHQSGEMDRVVNDLKSQHKKDVERMKDEHLRSLMDAQEAHALEVEEVKRSSQHNNHPVTLDHGRDINPDVVERMECDLVRLEEERDQLRSMQNLMKNLISDLATHYSLSEKQVRFLSDSTFFDSFFDPKSFDVNEDRDSGALPTPFKHLATNEVVETGDRFSSLTSFETSTLRKQDLPSYSPNQSVLSMEELSELMGNETFLSEIENSEHVFSELRRQVKKSNEVLQSLEPGTLLSKLSGLLTPPDIQENISENFVGLEAGRLEVEKARLELELTAARQRLQELELSGRNSMARSEVMSGLGGDISGEPNISNLDLETFHDLRERASRILSEQEEGNQDKPPEVINVLGELLLYCDQVSKSAKVQTLDLSQQLEAADKQLKATRQFLEEQAQERETEREEWERKIAAVRLQSTRHREEESVGFENEVREDADSEDASPSTSSEEKRELASAVDKIFQLREIIRTLETDIRQRAEAEKSSRAEVQELRTVLADALMGQQAIQEELELARSSSTDQDMIDLIEGLKDQLGSKTQELKAHRAAHQHLHDVKAHLRGLQERVVQSTRELNNSVAGGKSSANSSRGSSPLNIHPNGGSFEDIGVGGLEIEEVSRLERKLKILEVAEAATLNKIKRMEDEIQSLNAEKAKLSSRVEEMDKKSATTDLKMKKLKEENGLLEKELKDLRNHNFDDLQAENNLLQERMVSLQVQVSTLQGERQASKHRIPSSQGLELAIQEKEKILHQLDDTSARLEAAITEKDLLQRRCSGLVSKVAQLEMDLEAQGAVDDTPVDVVGALRRDKAELEEVNQKLLKEVSHARAAELAAHKVQMPKLAEDLLKEKNLEIDSLRSQLSDITSKTTNPLHSTPNSWSSNISKASVEQLRDAPVHTSHLPDLSFVVGRRDVCISTGKSSAPNLDPIQEFPDSSFNLRQGCLDGNRSLVENGERSNVAVSCVDGSGGLSATQSGTHEVLSPEVEITRRTEKQELGDEHTLNENLAELEELLSQKLSEIETLSAAVHEKESQIFDLQDRVNDFEEKLADVKNEAAEKNKLCSSLGDIIEKKDDNISSLTDNLQTCRDQLRQLQDEAMKDASPDLREEIKRLREEVSDRVQGMENIHAILQNNELEIKSRLKTEEDLKNKLSGAENEIAQLLIKTRQLSLDNLDLQSIKDSAEKKQEDLITAKRTLEEELTTVKREMSSIETVVKEMTGQFKQEVQSRENELENVKATLLLAQNSESVLSSKCTELEIDLNDAKMKLNLAQTQLSTKEFELNEQKNSTKKDELMPIEVGSLDDLTNLVQRELDISSDLDQTLLTQLVSGNSSFNTTGGGATEVQRLARKVQKDGVRVLSLSERLFLTQHTNEEKPRPADNDTKFRDIERQLELLQFEVEQERIVSHDYKHALESEKKNGLDIISKLSRERQLRSELEEELSVVQRQVRLLNKEKMKRLPSLVDSDNEEFLHTIQTQRQQIESLEDSLKLEKENFAHLQNVLTVERRRGRQEESSEERRNEDDISELRNQLRSERSYREKLESSLGGGKSGEVAKLIIGRLHSELEAERRRNCQLSVQLEREKKKYFDVYQEYKYKKSESIEKSAEGVGLDESWTRVWRTRELELERLVAELEMKVEVLQLEEGRTRQQVENLQIELNYERENNNSGLSKEQLARMRQVNAFLEHNLKENGEMLSTITRLQEDKQELKTKLGDSNRRLETCSCSTQPEDKTNVYSKFLRAESYRKALIWQKRYLLVQLSGGYFEKDPVLKVGQQNLFGLSRFKAAVHAVISIKRMKYLVDRWRSGKRSGLRPRAWSTVRGTAVSEINVGRSSSSQRRPDTLSLHSPVSQSVLSPRVEGTRGRAGVRRSSSLREKPMGRSLESPSSVSSTSSIFHPPVITGRTPPTRDVAGRRQVRASDPGSMEPVQEGFQARRSLGNQFKDGNFSSLRDPDLAADLKDYLDKFQTLEKQLGVKF